jgi:hypothetical protein
MDSSDQSDDLARVFVPSDSTIDCGDTPFQDFIFFLLTPFAFLLFFFELQFFLPEF